MSPFSILNKLTNPHPPSLPSSFSSSKQSTYYLSTSLPSPSIQALQTPPPPHQLPPSSLIFCLKHPRLDASPATTFFLQCLPDPIMFLHYAALFIRPRLALGHGGGGGDGQPGGGWRHQLITLELEEKDGLAATSGGKIGVSLDWVERARQEVMGGKKHVEQALKEFKGVLLHEMVHTIQHDGGGSTPTWLIESIADLHRLFAHLEPAHWRKYGQGKPDKGWEASYDTGARFLGWLIGYDEAEREQAERGEGKLVWEPEVVGGTVPGPTPTGPEGAQATRYAEPPSAAEQQPLGRPNARKARSGPYPDFVRLLDSRLVYERWDEGWWQEMTGRTLPQLWAEYLAYYQ
ncbi:hypothetical protein I350_00067 [Cryptococcus amylolentus CBS 6273]|uniref:Uncharacterized protein n=1 Tax=Cryptococcus amylolentus CBS 6273 TaxID=1296118 RepID=A0A1E3KDX2_9TREE|nr:hypothetical protein I350_00067 [Cryptococcus amylolentus CBS 6273]